MVKAKMKNASLIRLTIAQFLLAVSVMYCHSPTLSDGTMPPIWCRVLFGNQGGTLGGTAVHLFFVLSGYMLSKNETVLLDSPHVSLCLRTQVFVRFAVKRLLRIFPVVATATLVAVFLVGPMFTILELSDYFLNLGTWTYFQCCLLFQRVPTGLPGVFDGNIFPSVVNGVLWMIPWMMWSYVLFGISILLGVCRNGRFVVSLFAVFFVCLANADGISPTSMFCGLWTVDGIRLLTYFVAGWTMELCVGQKWYNRDLAILFILLMPIGFHSESYELVCALLGPYAMISLVFAEGTIPNSVANNWILRRVCKLPNLSFGIFVFGFMVQQSLTFMCGGRMSHNLNFILSVPIVILLAYVEYRMIELPIKNIRQRMPCRADCLFPHFSYGTELP